MMRWGVVAVLCVLPMGAVGAELHCEKIFDGEVRGTATFVLDENDGVTVTSSFLGLDDEAMVEDEGVLFHEIGSSSPFTPGPRTRTSVIVVEQGAFVPMTYIVNWGLGTASRFFERDGEPMLDIYHRCVRLD